MTFASLKKRRRFEMGAKNIFPRRFEYNVRRSKNMEKAPLGLQKIQVATKEWFKFIK